jgi:chromosome segregation ATPase
MKFSRSVLAAFLCAAVAVAAVVLLLAARREAAESTAALESARAHAQNLEQQTSVLASENQTLRQQMEAEGLQPATPQPATRPADPGKLEAVRELAALQTRHEALQLQVTGLQNRLAELDGALERLNAENRRLSAAESSLKDQLDSTRRVVTATETELKSKTGRVEQLEASLRRIRDQASGADRRASQITQSLQQIEDINRRREDTLNALQRRYRDVTDQLRSLALRLDTQRDNPVPLGATDLSRISSAVQSAEDDLRTLTSLNTQARSAIDRLQ